MLRDNGIAYVVAGESAVDLVKAVTMLGEQFGIRRPLLESGGHINGAFLQADLVDELSLLLVPGIDGRHEIPAVFDGFNSARKTDVSLKLKSFDRRDKDALWLRYEVVRIVNNHSISGAQQAYGNEGRDQRVPQRRRGK